MRSFTESVQNRVRPKWSMAIPSGLSRSVERIHFESHDSDNERLMDKSEHLPDLMIAVGSPPSMLALLIEGDVISVQ